MGATTWDQTYGGTKGETPSSLVQTLDGGYAIAGSKYPLDDYYNDFWLVKTDANGNMQWNQTYGEVEADEFATSLVQTVDGGYAIAGYSISFAKQGNGNFWLIKTDANGNVQWNRTYDGGANELPISLVQTSDGGYAMAGFTFYSSLIPSPTVTHYDLWLVKTDSSGNMQWNRTYDGGANEEAYSLVQTPDGGYALAGYTSSFGAGDSDFWLVKTDDYGNFEWNQTYGGANKDRANSLVQTGDGGYVLAGYTESFGAGDLDFWLVKTDADGNMEWNQTYGGTEADWARSMVKTSDGGFALAGDTSSFGAGDSDFWLVKVDSSGNIQGNQTYGGTGDDVARSLVQTSDGGYAMTGFTVSSDANQRDFWLVKTDEQSVIPEFTSLIIPLLFLAITLFVLILEKHVGYLSAT
jgi:hypothetical protein